MKDGHRRSIRLDEADLAAGKAPSAPFFAWDFARHPRGRFPPAGGMEILVAAGGPNQTS